MEPPSATLSNGTEKIPGARAEQELDDLLPNESLEVFVRQLARFNQAFTDAMVAGTDFTLRLEVHGNNSKLIHVRVYNDGFERPCGGEAVRRKDSLQ